MSDKIHKHNFVETYRGLLAQGFDRATDEATLAVYLQKLSDDEVLKILLPRLTAEDLTDSFEWLGKLVRRHLSEEEYHRLFLKDPPEDEPR